MILKLIGSSLIFISCSLFGYTFKRKSLIRIKELENILLCIEITEKEISLFLSNIVDIFDKIIGYATYYNKNIFTTAMKEYQKSDGEFFSKVWDENLENINNDIYSYNEICILKKFGLLLGGGDTSMQKKIIAELKTSLIELINNEKENEKKLSVSPKIGMYTGIVISVFLL